MMQLAKLGYIVLGGIIGVAVALPLANWIRRGALADLNDRNLGHAIALVATRKALRKLTRAVQRNAAALADSGINEALRLAVGELER